jgi:uncharacterized membrane protein YhaH (DUF805 family)
MGFGEAIGSCFRKFAVFRGRAPRSEYWYFILFEFLVGLPAAIFDQAIPGKTSVVSGLVSLVFFLPRLAVTVRRLHDVNRSGWWLGGFFLAVLAGIVLIVASLGNSLGSKPDFQSPIGLIAIVVLIGMFIYAIWLFVLSVLRGTTGPNDYGEDPFGSNVDVFN